MGHSQQECALADINAIRVLWDVPALCGGLQQIEFPHFLLPDIYDWVQLETKVPVAALHSALLQVFVKSITTVHATKDLKGSYFSAFGDVYNVHTAPYNDEARRSLHLLKTSDYESAKDDVPTHATQTCRWVLDHPYYTRWLNDDQSQVFWISAVPGCGKSVLAKMLVDGGLVQHRPSSICYFFFKSGLPEQEGLASALCAILHQLFVQQPCLLHHAVAEYISVGRNMRQEIPVLRRILCNAVSDPEAIPVTFIVDALDECHSQDRSIFFKLIHECYSWKSNHESQAKIKFLFTSRSDSNIRREYELLEDSVNSIWLQGETDNEQLRCEIDSVIMHEIESWCADFILPLEYREELHNAISRLEQRTYLWWKMVRDDVRTQLEENSQHDHKSIQFIVSQLPSSLEHAFECLLQRVPEATAHVSGAILQIMLAARRPLQIYEMAQILSKWRYEKPYAECHVSMNEYQLRRKLTTLCGSLVATVRTGLVFIHTTVRSFLKNAASVTTGLLQRDTRWGFPASFPLIHLKLTVTCNALLRSRQGHIQHFYSDRVYADHEYAIRFVWDHFYSAIESLSNTQALFRFARTIGFGMDLQVLDVNKMSLLHRLVQYDGSCVNYNLIQAVLERNGLVQSADNRGMHCLQYAAQRHDAELVKLLLRYGFQVNRLVTTKVRKCLPCRTTQEYEATNGLTALHAAVLFGSIQATMLLIENGADLAVADEEGSTPLHTAVSLSSPGAIAWKDGEYRVEHCEHCSYVLDGVWDYDEDHVEDVWRTARDDRLLILHNLCRKYQGLVHKKDRAGRTPLHLVRYNDRKVDAMATVELLLSYGADPRARDLKGITPIHMAAKGGNAECLSLLVPNGKEDELSTCDGEGRTSLHFAALSHNEEVVRYLLSRPKTTHLVCTVDHYGRDPLQCALLDISECGRLIFVDDEIITTLLENGAKAGHINDRGHDALAHYLTSQEIGCYATPIQILIRYGANARYCDEYGRNLAHHLASSNLEFDVEGLQFLQLAGAPVTATDKSGKNVLHHAAIHGSLNSSLLKYACEILDLDPNAADASGKRPLDYAKGQRSVKRHPHLFRGDRWEQVETLLSSMVFSKSVSDVQSLAKVQKIKPSRFVIK